MKKYARLRQECLEFDNALYDATPEVSFTDHSRALPTEFSGSEADSQCNSPHIGLASALKKLGSFREVSGSRRESDSQWEVRDDGGDNGEPRSRSSSGKWGSNAQEEVSESGRWANAETASLSGRWGSVSTNEQSFRDSLSLSRSGRLVQDGEPWTAHKTFSIPRQSSLQVRDATVLPELLTTASPRPNDLQDPAVAPNTQQKVCNISMKETQGWLASVKRPLQPRKPHSAAWDDPNEFNWRAATSTNGRESSSWSASRSSSRKAATTVSQSMRYDRLKTIDLLDNPSFGDEDGYYHRNGNGSSRATMMQKAASMREGGAHSATIMAMARAYSEKHGVPQAILECVACGRGLGVIVHGNPANDTSFCQSCRPHAIGGWTYRAKAPETGKSKRKGMMHFCKKILRMGKKPHNSKGP